MAERQQSNQELNDKHKELSAKEIFDLYKNKFNEKIKLFFN